MYLQGYSAFAVGVEAGGGKPRAPPKGAETRWVGFLPMLAWVNDFSHYLVEYEEPSDCVANDDGTVYGQHALVEDEWIEVMQLVSA